MLWVNIDLTAVSGKTSPLRLYLIESSGDDFSRVYFQIGLTFLFLFSHFRLLTFIGTTQAPMSELLNVYSNLQKHREMSTRTLAWSLLAIVPKPRIQSYVRANRSSIYIQNIA